MYCKFCLVAAFFLLNTVNAREDKHDDCYTLYESQSCAADRGPWQPDKECSGCHPTTHFCADHTGWFSAPEAEYNKKRWYADIVESIFDLGFENYTEDPFLCWTLWPCKAYCQIVPLSDPPVYACVKDPAQEFYVANDNVDTLCE